MALPETAPNAKTPRCSRSHSHCKAAMVYEEQAPPAEQRNCPCVRRRGTQRSKLQGTKVYDETAPTAKPPRTGSLCKAAKPPRCTKKELARCQAASHQGVRRGRHHCKAARCTKTRPPLPDATPWRCTKIRLPMPGCKAARCTKSKKPLPSCEAAKVYQGEAPTAQLQSRPTVYEDGSIIATL